MICPSAVWRRPAYIMPGLSVFDSTDFPEIPGSLLLRPAFCRTYRQQTMEHNGVYDCRSYEGNENHHGKDPPYCL